MLKKIIGLIAGAIMVVTMGLSATAAADPALKQTYKNDYAAYKVFYQQTYVPAYHAYNASLKAFSQSVKNMELNTVDDYNRVMDFINRIKAERKAFFGDRVTPGTSRYDVPMLRNAMYESEEKEDYSNAITYCTQLVTAVQMRMDFLGYLSDQISGFEVNPSQPDVADVTLKFEYEKWNDSDFGYKITITNTTNSPISDWLLAFDFKNPCKILSAWMQGGQTVLSVDGTRVNISLVDQWQNGYTIPAGGSVVIQGNATGGVNFADPTNANFNGKTATII